ncbi:acyltransferase family protein [Salirhabdus sp. Marseille-P4669]|uniref:acyltransferase family protein n=1 Tax=Salirhabdus sp. Marseille-P4669 TaxID=2042310 RepID=UPI0013593FAA|nr:acyltransferase [Salirhabdus sp. Marseille-P4669]
MKKIYYLEGFRGLAAFIVVIAHYMQFYFYDPLFKNPNTSLEIIISKTPLNLFYNGNFAVFSFFVLSGYVLSIKFFRDRKLETIQASASKRYIRLAIPVLSSVIIAYVLLVTNSYELFSQYTGDMRYDDMSHNLFVMIKTALFDIFFDYSNAYIGVLWTMTYELFGSFLIFSFLSLFGINPKRYIAYMFLIVLFWDSYFLAFILGMLLSDLYNSDLEIKTKTKPIATLLIFIIGLLLGSYPYGNTTGTIYNFLNFSFLNVEYRAFFHILGAFFIIIAILNSKILQKVFSKRIFIYLGKVSFPLYLVHFPILHSLSFFIFDLVRRHYSYHISFTMAFIVSIIVTFIIAHLFSVYIDEKAVKVSNYFYKHFFRSRKETKM